MAKDKSTSKTGRTKLPKQIAGVKIPKQLRKKGGELLDKANSPAGREVIAAGLTMVAAAASAAAAKHRAPNPPTPPTPPQGTQHGPDPQMIADALGQAADAMFNRFFPKKG